MDLNKKSIFQIIETNNFFDLCSKNSENKKKPSGKILEGFFI